MTVTSPVISFGSNAIAIKDDIATLSYSSPGRQSFSVLADLKFNELDPATYATYEPDFWLLDGNYKFKPDTTVHVGLVSGSLSDNTGDLPGINALTIIFGSAHDTNGLTLYFSEGSGDYISYLKIKYNDNASATIREDEYNPTSTTFSTGQAVAGVRSIVIYFYTTSRPYRYARLEAIDFDTMTTFTGAEIKSARVVEQISPLSVEMPSNTIDFSLFSSVGAFSIVAPTGVYANLQYKEPLDVYEKVNGNRTYIGRFYLDKWESRNENLADFQASDAIALMEKIDYLPEGTSTNHVDPFSYYSGGTTNAVLSEDLIADMMLQAGLSYSLDASLEGITISPATLTNKTWLPVAPIRECLQLVLFRIGAYATCARSSIVQIKPFELASDLTTYDHTITSADKGLNQPVKLRTQVTGVELTSHDYAYEGTTSKQIVNFDPIAVGTHIVKFTQPYVDFSYAFAPVGSVTQVTYGSAWIEYSVSAEANLRITGSIITDTPAVTGVYLSPAPDVTNILSIDATMVNKSNASTVATRVYNYYLQRYLQKTRLFAPAAKVGDSILIDTQSSRQIGGIMERMEIDLANGFVANCDIVGVVVPL